MWSGNSWASFAYSYCCIMGEINSFDLRFPPLKEPVDAEVHSNVSTKYMYLKKKKGEGEGRSNMCRALLPVVSKSYNHGKIKATFLPFPVRAMLPSNGSSPLSLVAQCRYRIF